ncbi:MAG: aspartyl/asparaginyl beta-hydroxylase domain-containing protein [Methylococcales bacterium]
MKLESEFYKLPLKFDIERMIYEVNSFSESDWVPHPSGFQGNSSIPLISVNGESNERFAGPMELTPSLKKCPYIMQVISSFNEVFGRSRLMRLGPGYEVPIHSDINYHWYSRVRIHIPIITFPEVIFHCGDKTAHMAAGEAWIFDAWRMHKVINGADKNRVHLVIDTAGSSKFWDMVSRSDEPHNNVIHSDILPQILTYEENAKPKIQTENYNVPGVMSPGELDALCIELVNDANLNTSKNDAIELKIYAHCIHKFRQDWRSTWSIHGPQKSGWPIYQDLINIASKEMQSIKLISLMSNPTDARQIFNARVLISCLNNQILEPTKTKPKSIIEEKPGRNSLCPCGSGKKYKRCHGANN